MKKTVPDPRQVREFLSALITQAPVDDFTEEQLLFWIRHKWFLKDKLLTMLFEKLDQLMELAEWEVMFQKLFGLTSQLVRLPLPQDEPKPVYELLPVPLELIINQIIEAYGRLGYTVEFLPLSFGWRNVREATQGSYVVSISHSTFGFEQGKDRKSYATLQEILLYCLRRCWQGDREVTNEACPGSWTEEGSIPLVHCDPKIRVLRVELASALQHTDCRLVIA